MNCGGKPAAWITGYGLLLNQHGSHLVIFLYELLITDSDSACSKVWCPVHKGRARRLQVGLSGLE